MWWFIDLILRYEQEANRMKLIFYNKKKWNLIFNVNIFWNNFETWIYIKYWIESHFIDFMA